MPLILLGFVLLAIYLNVMSHRRIVITTALYIDGEPTAMRCTMVGTQTWCADKTHVISLAAGQLYSFRVSRKVNR